MGFSKTFSLDKTVDEEKLTATVKNGILTVSAPKDLKKLEENVRRIPVVATVAVDNTDEKGENENSDNSDNDDGSLKMEEQKTKEDEEAEEAAMDLDKE